MISSDSDLQRLEAFNWPHHTGIDNEMLLILVFPKYFSCPSLAVNSKSTASHSLLEISVIECHKLDNASKEGTLRYKSFLLDPLTKQFEAGKFVRSSST